MINAIDNSTPEKLRQTMAKTVDLERKIPFVQGELLYIIKKNDYWREWGFVCFDEYVRRELRFKTKKACSLIKIYERFVIQLGVSMDDLQDIAWTKAVILMPAVNRENVHYLIGDARKLTGAKLSLKVREITGGSNYNKSKLPPATIGSVHAAVNKILNNEAWKSVYSPRVHNALLELAEAIQETMEDDSDEL